MNWDAKDLLHWLRQWGPINNSLLYFSNHSQVLHPFAVPFSSGGAASSSARSLVGRHESSAEVIGQGETEAGAREADDVAVGVEAAFNEATDSSNVLMLYARVYDMLSTFGKVGFWSNAVILEQLLASSISAWVVRLCASSGGRLQACPAPSIEELKPRSIWWSSRELSDAWEEALETNSRPWTTLAGVTAMDDVEAAKKRSRDRPVRVMPEDASHERRPHSGDGEECHPEAASHRRGETAKREAEEEEEEEILALHSLVTFALHYHRMRWVLRVVFLRVDVELDNIAWRIMRSCVLSTLKYNTVMIESVLHRTVEYCLENSHACHEPTTAELAQADAQACFDAVSTPSFSLDALRCLRDRDVLLVCRVLSMLDECCAQEISRLVTDRVVGLNEQHGCELAYTNLAPLLVQDGTGTNDKAPRLKDAFGALQNCMNAFMRLRSSMLLYFGGGTQHVDQLSTLGREGFSKAERAFSVGFCQGVVFLKFVDAWALPLWLYACEEEQERWMLSTTARAARWSSVKEMTGQLDDSIGVRSHSRTLWQLGQVEASGGSSTTENGSLPRSPGFATLIFFLNPEPKLLSDFEACFGAAVRRYFEELLAKSHTTGAPLQALPRDVYQHCVFLLRLTNQLLEPPASAGCAGAHATLRAVRKGMQKFFSERESCVVLTLASALHEQVAVGNSHGGPADGGGTYLEIIDTILELASLLHSKDLFVNCYCGLLAPRLMMAQQSLTLDMDTEVISRLAVRLGDALAAEPCALLRDIRAGTPAPHRISPVAGALQQPELLRHVRVLCKARWEKYARVTVNLSEMQRCFEEGQWFDAKMLYAMRAFEERFDGVEGNGAGSNSRKHVSSRVSRCTGFLGSRGSLDGGDDADHSIASQEDHVLAAAAGSRSAESRRTSLPASSTFSGAECVLQRRRLSWSLGSGALTVVCHAAQVHERDPVSSVQLVMPPVGLLLLQALERYDDSSTTTSVLSPTSCTLEFLHDKLPVEVPKPLLAAVLGGLVRHRIVRRTAAAIHRSNTAGGGGGAGGSTTYSLPASFAECRKRKVVIDAASALHHWVPYLQEEPGDSKAIVMTVDGILDTERLRKLEAGIVRIMKEKHSLAHSDLFNSVAALLVNHFAVTAPMFKRCVSQLIEREFIARQERDTYVYLV
ncbi:uncharacterized protein Tco025E_01353 [Trypanosoma conorhini]|uniref:Cullin neddylation domain-containing protein n=1 Tax=Trypanosoma conorhini TaxID=83891 RepID=A0A422Q9D1_9TRYP|nr:uncharacterized protein Tco025E_01353 [Trypanosoma conorhini]RNF26583.1 hypothetical protein Tco025E_01353 [Trypanosoma conorhini]